MAARTPRTRASAAVAAGRPVLVVTCDEHGTWHLHADHDPDPSPTRECSGAAAFEADPTLHQLDGLLPGWMARRPHAGAAWTRVPA